MASGSRKASTMPVCLADIGMPWKRAPSGGWHRTRPPASWTSRMPREPSLPAPERMMATERRPMSCASDRKKWSMGRLKPRTSSLSVRRSLPPEMIISFLAGMR